MAQIVHFFLISRRVSQILSMFSFRVGSSSSPLFLAVYPFLNVGFTLHVHVPYLDLDLGTTCTGFYG